MNEHAFIFLIAMMVVIWVGLIPWLFKLIALAILYSRRDALYRLAMNNRWLIDTKTYRSSEILMNTSLLVIRQLRRGESRVLVQEMIRAMTSPPGHSQEANEIQSELRSASDDQKRVFDQLAHEVVGFVVWLNVWPLIASRINTMLIAPLFAILSLYIFAAVSVKRISMSAWSATGAVYNGFILVVDSYSLNTFTLFKGLRLRASDVRTRGMDTIEAGASAAHSVGNRARSMLASRPHGVVSVY